ncbi:hypothetical protein [Undibacterium squillarum]|nr:hypothetical protein [Undibacterium squillarum]
MKVWADTHRSVWRKPVARAQNALVKGVSAGWMGSPALSTVIA